MESNMDEGGPTGEGEQAQVGLTINIHENVEQFKQEVERAFVNGDSLLEFVTANHSTDALNTPVLVLDPQAKIPESFIQVCSSTLDRHKSFLTALKSPKSITDEKLIRIEKLRAAFFYFFSLAAVLAFVLAVAGYYQTLVIVMTPFLAVLCTLGKLNPWRFMKQESALKNRQEVLIAMIVSHKISIKYLACIKALALHLNSESKSEPETTIDGQRTTSAAVVMTSFEKLRLKVTEYNKELMRSKGRVIDRVITSY